MIQEGGAEAVKLEAEKTWRQLSALCVILTFPVMGHIGLTPQSIHRMGGYKIQGKEERQRQKLLAKDALALEAAGAFSSGA